MKILMINKFLFEHGGSETYMIELGNKLSKLGHDIQYFGMDSKYRCLYNNVGSYASNIDFHSSNIVNKVKYSVMSIYNSEARRKLRKVLDDFEPDVCHINNFNYQLTPSILLEIGQWRKTTKRKCKIIYTAHDYQLLCPNHMFYNDTQNKVCEKCLKNTKFNCLFNKCIHNSYLKSLVGAFEAVFWHYKKTYLLFDTIICCSRFIKDKFDCVDVFKNKTIFLQNFSPNISFSNKPKKEKYVLYFGRLSKEKGMEFLLEAARVLTDITFVIAGEGEYHDKFKSLPNCKCLGFITGEKLHNVISSAMVAVFPSIWFENCPFGVIESIKLSTPVLVSNIGGLPEMVISGVTGDIFIKDDLNDFTSKIKKYYETNRSTFFCGNSNDYFLNIDDYASNLLRIYSKC